MSPDPFVVGSSVTGVFLEMTGPKLSFVSVQFYFIYINVANKTRNKETTVKLNLSNSATNKDNYPQMQKEKRLPKYDSQSETTIDSCL